MALSGAVVWGALPSLDQAGLGSGTGLIGGVRGGATGGGVEDRGQVTVHEPAVQRSSPEGPSHGRGAGDFCQGDGFGHFHVHPLGAGGGCFDQQGPGAFPEGRELGLIAGAGLDDC